MKIAVIVVRILIGLLLLFASVVVLFKLMPQPEMTGSAKVFNDGIVAAVYLMPFIKITELLCGLAFISGRFVTLATVVIFPITLNILLYHIFVVPEGLPVALFLIFGNLFLAYYYRKNYQALFAVK